MREAKLLASDDQGQFDVIVRAPEGSSVGTTRTILESIAARVRRDVLPQYERLNSRVIGTLEEGTGLPSSTRSGTVRRPYVTYRLHFE